MNIRLKNRLLRFSFKKPSKNPFVMKFLARRRRRRIRRSAQAADEFPGEIRTSPDSMSNEINETNSTSGPPNSSVMTLTSFDTSTAECMDTITPDDLLSNETQPFNEEVTVMCSFCQSRNVDNGFSNRSEFLKHLSLVHYRNKILIAYPFTEGSN